MGLECCIHFGDGILLHPRQNVAVQVERYADLGMPEALAGNLHMDARGQHVRGVAVPQIVEADAGQAGALYGLEPFVREAVRLYAFTGSGDAAMADDDSELPVSEIYRGVEIYGLQPPERVAEAKLQVDQVFIMKSPRALATFACDDANAPEARLLAKHKALAALEKRQGRPFDVAYLNASTIGIERTTSQLGRLIGSRQAEWWPRAWLAIEKGK